MLTRDAKYVSGCRAEYLCKFPARFQFLLAISITPNNDVYGVLVYECYVMSKYCFEGHDMLCATDWAIQAYKKWTNGEDGDGDGGRRTMRVDIEKLKHYMISSSVYTGTYSLLSIFLISYITEIIIVLSAPPSRV